jgi:hypothetical protein
MAGLGMAWINICIAFVLGGNSDTNSLLELCIQCISALCLAIAASTLQPVVKGLELLQVCCSSPWNCLSFFFGTYVKNCGLQGFIEWKIANSIMQACLSILGGNQNLFELVIATCLFFSIVSLLAGTIPFYTVFQSISSVMFTNSSVNWIMQILSPLATGSSSLGLELVSLAAGLALTHALLSILFANHQVS